MQRDIAGVQNRLGFFFFQLAFFGFAGISSIDLILEERSVFIREIQGKFYTPLAYYLSKVIVDGIMLRILPMLIYDLLVYWSIGLREGAAHFALYLISTLLFSLATGALSIAVTMGSKTGGVASLGIILLLLFSILFGGFLSNRGAIPDWIGWIQYLSIYYQVMGVLVSNEMRGTTFSTTISKGIEIEISADQVLDKIEFAVEPNLTSYVGALAALYFAWIFIGYVLMKIYLSDGRDWKRMWKKMKQC
jgi:ABC-type multidrug transport system permease subunit